MTQDHDNRVILCHVCAGTGFDLKKFERVKCKTCGGSGLTKPPVTVTSFLNDPRHWRMRAEEMRRLTEEMRDEDARGMMLRLVNDYEKIAARMEQTSQADPLPRGKRR